MSGRAQSSSDEEQIREIIRRVYQSVSGPAGRRDREMNAALFDARACLSVMHAGEGVDHLESLTLDAYWESRGPWLAANAFFEDEVSTTVVVTGATATAVSHYDSRTSRDEAPFESGTNHFQLVRRTDGWRIVAMLWQAGIAAASIVDVQRA